MKDNKTDAGVEVVNPNCRKCGRPLVDESDLWAGVCNNDDACKKRRETNFQNERGGMTESKNGYREEDISIEHGGYVVTEEKLVFDEMERMVLVAGYGNLIVALKEKNYKRCEEIISYALNLIGKNRYEQAEEIMELEINKAVKEHREEKK